MTLSSKICAVILITVCIAIVIFLLFMIIMVIAEINATLKSRHYKNSLYTEIQANESYPATIPMPVSGRIFSILKNENDTIHPGDLLAVLEIREQSGNYRLEIKSTETRVIKKITCKVGDNIKKGSVLFGLE